MGQRTEAIKREIDATREEIAETIDAVGYRTNVPARVKDRAGRVKDKVADTASEAKEAVESGLSEAKRGLSSATRRARSAVPTSRDVRVKAQRAVHAAEANPLGLAAAGLAAGFLVGSVIPSTRKENETI